MSRSGVEAHIPWGVGWIGYYSCISVYIYAMLQLNIPDHYQSASRFYRSFPSAFLVASVDSEMSQSFKYPTPAFRYVANPSQVK